MASPTAVPITTTPAADQLIEHDGTTYETIREGHAYILIPPGTQKSVDPQANAKGENSSKPQNVFYNPIQQFNRDLSVLAIKAFGEDWLNRRRLRNHKHRQQNSKRNAKKRKRQEADAADNGAGCEIKLPKLNDEPRQPADADEDGGVHIQASDDSNKDGTVAQGNGQSSTPSGPRFRVLDALSATGLRAIRYAKEIPFVTTVVANDMDPNAIKNMELNIQHNDLTSQITPNTGDAIQHMFSVAFPPPKSHGPHHVNSRYDAIDLDPYGTAAPFMEAALQAINDGGLLCVTCTDSGVFASTGYCEKTYALYGGAPAKGPYMHEAGLRLIIQSIANRAAVHGIAIEPLLSLSIDFYARVFIRVRKSPADVKFLFGKTMQAYCCDYGCGAWTVNLLGRNTKQEGKDGKIWYKHTIGQGPTSDRLCEHCGSKKHIAGPMWGGPLHNAAFIEKILDDLQHADTDVYETLPRIEGMLTTALDELSVNEPVTKYTPAKDREEETSVDMIPRVPPEVVDHHPFFTNPSLLSKVIHCVAPSSAAINGALRHAGYRVTRSHCQRGSLKTDAPWTVIWEIMREWTRQKHPIKEGALKEGSAGYRIMQAARATEKTVVTQGNDAATTETSDTAADVGGPTTTKNGSDSTKRMEVVFDEALGKDKPGKRLVRYQTNPRENWGPMARAKGASNANSS